VCLALRRPGAGTACPLFAALLEMRAAHWPPLARHVPTGFRLPHRAQVSLGCCACMRAASDGDGVQRRQRVRRWTLVTAASATATVAGALLMDDASALRSCSAPIAVALCSSLPARRSSSKKTEWSGTSAWRPTLRSAAGPSACQAPERSKEGGWEAPILGSPLPWTVKVPPSAPPVRCRSKLAMIPARRLLGRRWRFELETARAVTEVPVALCPSLRGTVPVALPLVGLGLEGEMSCSRQDKPSTDPRETFPSLQEVPPVAQVGL
jgi:hypothetical protein